MGHQNLNTFLAPVFHSYFLIPIVCKKKSIPLVSFNGTWETEGKPGSLVNNVWVRGWSVGTDGADWLPSFWQSISGQLWLQIKLTTLAINIRLMATLDCPGGCGWLPFCEEFACCPPCVWTCFLWYIAVIMLIYLFLNNYSFITRSKKVFGFI